MNDHNALKTIIKDMEKVARAIGIEPFPVYFLGGSACIMGQYTDRATRDFDFVDLGYPAKYGKVLRYMNDFDMLEYESTILAPSYKTRAKKLDEFTYLEIYILSKEDIIVSKIIRMEKKDLEDMDQMMPDCDKRVILQIIDEALGRTDLFSGKKEEFIRKLPAFKERYDV